MKYDPNRNYLYPVLRPYSDDYGDSTLATNVHTEAVNGIVRISVGFQVSEPSIEKLVADGYAQCSAMIYCRDTLYRETVKADIGNFRLNKSIPLNRLANNVELHPVIVTNGDLLHSTDTAHEEYGAETVRVDRWQPLATDQTWHFQVNPNIRHTNSIFDLIPDDLPDGDFDIQIDHKERYIKIIASALTLEQFKPVRRENVDIAASSVYMSVLVDALSYLKHSYLDEEEIRSDGWVTCIKNNLNLRNINLGSNEEHGTHSLFRAAQLLLDSPFRRMIDQEDIL